MPRRGKSLGFLKDFNIINFAVNASFDFFVSYIIYNVAKRQHSMNTGKRVLIIQIQNTWGSTLDFVYIVKILKKKE